MNLGLFRREHLESGDAQLVGDAVADQFQRTHGALTAWQETEHTDSGSHTDIHADSIDVTGDASIGGDATIGGDISGSDGHVGLGDLPPEAAPGQGPQLGGYGVKFDPWRIVADRQGSGAPSALMFQYLNETLGDYLFRFIRNTTYDWTMHAVTGVAMRLGSVANRLTSVEVQDANAVRVNVGGSAVAPSGTQFAQNSAISACTVNAPLTGVSHNSIDLGVPSQRLRRAYLGDSLYEWDRATGMGVWIDVPTGSMTFTTPAGPFFVGAGSNVRYTLIGKTVMILYDFRQCNVPVAAGNLLSIHFPSTLGWLFAATVIQQPMGRALDADVVVPCFAQVASGLELYAYRADFASWTGTAAGTYLNGLFVAPIL